jgi:hypothetical protein
MFFTEKESEKQQSFMLFYPPQRAVYTKIAVLFLIGNEEKNIFWRFFLFRGIQ